MLVKEGLASKTKGNSLLSQIKSEVINHVVIIHDALHQKIRELLSYDIWKSKILQTQISSNVYSDQSCHQSKGPAVATSN